MRGKHPLEMTSAEHGQRLDRYLRKLLPDVPLGAIFKMLRRGVIRVDGKKAKQDLRLAEGMVVTMPPSLGPLGLQGAAASPAPAPAASNLLPRIVHRDDDLLVVDKPAGLAVQPGSGHDHHVLSWLDQQPFGVRTATYRPAPVHRIDRGTSGLLCIGLTPQASRALASSFREDRVRKRYVAVVEGVPDDAAGTIDAPLLLRETARAKQPKVLVDARGKPARTDYERLENGRGRALLRLLLHTGRTHQIRAHLGHVGHPIVGDARYGSRSDLGHGVFLLHAEQLSLPHPESGESLNFTAPIPSAFRAAL